ncbi:tRNA glutamyl-Q(34) synthetase GluQRS [Arenimonas fontis]|uniref:Glutamyl-Q tRNA(Asp) synthetase n=1 Tax=Arenimonas fontis TaxID=2608255 RepID=A0A5B2ZBQ7_9GAMM|nr:tRNA glutamyl-Q(34) synthetase GluQRS [Arenimonas fontis]KAA2285499.1 tRNA glutamyl-Q(34) synthetase GluQRS [Arenimonas fontis]
MNFKSPDTQVRPVGRFAPSPTGPLHFGSLVAALGSWLMARWRGGAWKVRIEDLDPPREVPGAAERQLATLRAFGLEPDGEVWRQSRRHEAYSEALARLLAAGDAFECHCSRADLASAGGIHRRCLRGPVPGRRPAVRLRVTEGRLGFNDGLQGRFEQDLAREVGDVVLRRADGYWAYQLAVVVDDAAQGVTEVVRGADLLDSTPRQILLQRKLGLPTPAYLHLPLVLDERGRKLGKSLGALAVDADEPWPALRAAWTFLGQDPAALPRSGDPAKALERALPWFQPARLPSSSRPVSRIDAAKTRKGQEPGHEPLA